jgi:hypothetical protein
MSDYHARVMAMGEPTNQLVRRDADAEIAAEADAAIEELDALIEKLAGALLAMVQHFPTDGDLIEAGWTSVEVELACTAHDTGKAALAAHAKHKEPK